MEVVALSKRHIGGKFYSMEERELLIFFFEINKHYLSFVDAGILQALDWSKVSLVKEKEFVNDLF